MQGPTEIINNTPLDIFKEFVKQSVNWADLLEKFNLGARQRQVIPTIKKRAEIESIDFSHFNSKNRREHISYSDEELFVIDSCATNITIKKRINKSCYLENVCSCCKIDPVWQNKPMTLHLDHINGCHTDNRLSNLQYLCYNCHSQTPTHNRNKKSDVYRIISEIPREEFQEIINSSKSWKDLCIYLYNESNVDVNRYVTTWKLCTQLSQAGLIDISHFPKIEKRKNQSLEKYLNMDLSKPTNLKSFFLTQVLLKIAKVPYCCSICQHPPIWRNQLLMLQVDHISGNHFDNNLNNLRLLCPNCHGQFSLEQFKTRKEKRLNLSIINSSSLLSNRSDQKIIPPIPGSPTLILKFVSHKDNNLK